MLKRKFVLPTLGVAVIAVAISSLVLGSSTASAHKGRHRQRATAADTSAAILNAFAVLRKAASAGGAPLPSSVETAASDESSQASKIAPELTVETKVQKQYPVWVAAEAGKLCLIENGIVDPGMASSDCGTSQEALEGKLISYTTTPSGTPVTTGLAPNGNTSVIATEANGSSRTVSVNENVYEIVGNAPLAITLSNASGQTTTAQPGG
jgi:hypothetical protein